MAYSYVEFTNTTGTGPFSYASVALLPQDTEAISTQLKVYRNGLLQSFTTQYTIDTVASTVTINVGLIITDTLRIVRDTKKNARYVDYEDSTNVTSELLNLDSNQNFFLVQEAVDLQTDSMVRNDGGQWEGRGLTIQNIAAGVNGTDAVTVNQMNAATSGSLPAVLSGMGAQAYTGDGVLVDFAIPASIADITDPSDVAVYVNGIRQLPGSHYSIVTPNVHFEATPANADAILMTWPEGVISGLVTANSVSTAALQSECVTVAKIDGGTNNQVLTTVGAAATWSNLTAAHVTNFNTAVRTSRLDQMAAPTASVSMGSQKISSLATPTANNDAVNKSYADGNIAKTVASWGFTATGSTSTVTGSTTAVGFLIGYFSLTVPFNQNATTHYFSVSSAVVSTFQTGTIRVFVPDTDAGGGSYFSVVFTRTGGSLDGMTFVVTLVDSNAVGNAITLINGGTMFAHFARGVS
jgi:hypothetical protein